MKNTYYKPRYRVIRYVAGNPHGFEAQRCDTFNEALKASIHWKETYASNDERITYKIEYW